MTKYKSDFLNILDERGFIHQCSDFAGLDKKLTEGVQSAYVGYDPTGASLHIGHLYSVMILHWFQKCGHKPISLMGGGTALVGDPSDKDTARPILSESEIKKNIESIKGVFSQFIQYGSGKTEGMMVNNADWLTNLNYMGFLRDIGRHVSINRMISFDFVKRRIQNEQNLSLLEFNYMLLQGYDFIELHKRYGTILQMGGSDQWGNIINGVELGHKILQKELFALTAPLLTTSSGAKMGKTAGGAVWLNADQTSPYDYYQYWRNVEDADVVRLLKIFTLLPMAEIAKLEKLRDAEINEAKKVLAYEATKLCHGEAAATDAAATAQKVFEQGGVGDNLPTISIEKSRLPVPFVDILVESGLVSSKGEGRRLMEQGGARLDGGLMRPLNSDIRIDHFEGRDYIKLSAGKKKHALVKIK